MRYGATLRQIDMLRAASATGRKTLFVVFSQEQRKFWEKLLAECGIENVTVRATDELANGSEIEFVSYDEMRGREGDG